MATSKTTGRVIPLVDGGENVLEYGTGANNIVVRDGNGLNPITASDLTGVDGSGLTNLPSSSGDQNLRQPIFSQATGALPSNVGMIPIAQGSGTAVSDSSGTYYQMTSSGSTGSFAGWNLASGTGTESPAHIAAWYLTFKTGPSIDACRFWVGAANNLGNTLSSNDDPVTAVRSCAALRYSTVVDGTAFWRFVTSDGVTKTETTTTFPIAVSTRYKVKIVPTTGSIACYIDGVLVATHTTNLPSFSATIGMTSSVTTLENQPKLLLHGRFCIEYSV